MFLNVIAVLIAISDTKFWFITVCPRTPNVLTTFESSSNSVCKLNLVVLLVKDTSKHGQQILLLSLNTNKARVDAPKSVICWLTIKWGVRVRVVRLERDVQHVCNYKLRMRLNIVTDEKINSQRLQMLQITNLYWTY